MLIAYGGDGTLAGLWQKAYDKHMPIWPIRNYGICRNHEDYLKTIIDDDVKIKDTMLKMTVHSLVEARYQHADSAYQKLALNEIQIKNSNITEALRFDVYVNDRKYYENVIADGAVFSTVNGATGYWKSITRTIFRDGCGLAFIAPTVGISSLILKSTDNVKLVLTRDACITMSYDKDKFALDANKGFEIVLSAAVSNVSIIGYDEFMCFECRKNRNSTILQDQYIV